MPTLTFKVSADEAARIQQAAHQARLTVSAYLRRQASAAPVAVSKPGRVRCPVTGALIFGAMPAQPALTTEAVREMLVDFP